ncbi:hypothetical protein QUF63_11745 [Anaerolineales bacterium HSG25]|nr:hypothetical protein [Anaerolineales bacterium HSG25]
MIVTKELLKSEIDKLPESYIDLLYRIVQAMLTPLERFTTQVQPQSAKSWADIVDETYGSLADNPIERAPQGEFEIREAIV